MNTIDKQKMDLYIQEGQKVGLSGKDVINGFVKRGFEVEGIDNNAVKIELGLIEPEDNSFNPIKRTGQMLGDIPQDIQKTGQNIASTFQRGQERIGNIQERTISGEQSLASGAFQTIGQGLSTGAGIIGDLFIGGASLFTTPQEEQVIQDKLVQGVQALGKTDVGQGVAELADQYNEFKQSNPEIAGNLEASLGFAEAVLEVTGAGPGLKAAKQAGRRGTQAVANATGEALEATAGVLKNVPSVSGISKPKKGIEQLVKEITQEGDPRKLKQNIEALTSIADDIDPQKGLTVQGLRSQVKDKQKAIIQAVDDELLKDTKLYSIDELTDSFEGRSGVITTNPVKDTFEELDTIYTQAKDFKGLDELNFLRNKAETVGLSKKEVNDLARIYNRDAAKGFSKSGEPLTSVGAQASENTRKSLKNVARSGLSDNVKELDSIYGKTIQLDKSLNAFEKGVNNLQKKAGDRGIIEQLSNKGAKIFNLVTANGARGFMSGLLQSNVGSKTRNFLALEKALADNLKLLQKAGSPKASNSTIINAIEGIAKKLKNVDLPDIETKPFLDIDTPVKDLGKRIKDTPNKQGGFVKNPLVKGSDDLIEQAKYFDSGEQFWQESGSKLRREVQQSQGIRYQSEIEDWWNKNVKPVKESPKTVAQQLEGKIKPVTKKFGIIYHGTSKEAADSIRKGGFKKGSELAEGSYRGGGYDAVQDSISFATDKKSAEIFSTLTRNGEVLQSSIKPNSKVVSIDEVTHAEDLNEYIEYLRKEGVDAVYIGGGENELVIINKDIIKNTK